MKPFPFLLFTLLPVALTALARSADKADATDLGSFTLASVSNEALRNNPSIEGRFVPVDGDEGPRAAGRGVG